MSTIFMARVLKAPLEGRIQKCSVFNVWGGGEKGNKVGGIKLEEYCGF